MTTKINPVKPLDPVVTPSQGKAVSTQAGDPPRVNPYDEILSIVEASKPAPNDQKLNQIKQKSRVNAFGEGLRTLFEAVGAGAGASIPKRGVETKFQALHDKELEDHRERYNKWREKVIGVADKKRAWQDEQVKYQDQLKRQNQLAEEARRKHDEWVRLQEERLALTAELNEKNRLSRESQGEANRKLRETQAASKAGAAAAKTTKYFDSISTLGDGMAYNFTEARLRDALEEIVKKEKAVMNPAYIGSDYAVSSLNSNQIKAEIRKHANKYPGIIREYADEKVDARRSTKPVVSPREQAIMIIKDKTKTPNQRKMEAYTVLMEALSKQYPNGIPKSVETRIIQEIETDIRQENN